jgi:hypothetical protein
MVEEDKRAQVPPVMNGQNAQHLRGAHTAQPPRDHSPNDLVVHPHKASGDGVRALVVIALVVIAFMVT